MTQNYIKTRVRLPNSNESNLFTYVPVAGYTNPGIAMFDEDYFNIDADGKVSIHTQGNSSIVTKTYLETNYYDKTTIDTTLSTKLDKVISSADSLRLYGINEDGSQTTKFAAISGANTVMLRDNAGKSQVTTPSDGDSDLVIANKGYVDNAGFLKQIGFYNQLVPIVNQSVTTITIDSITYYLLGGLSNVKEGYAYYVGEVNNVHYWDTFVCLRVVNGTALFWPFRTISGSVPNNVTARKHVFVIDENGKNDTIKYSVDPHAGTGYRSIMQRDANGRSQVNDPSANLDVANKQWTLAQISSLGTVFNVKGTVATVSALPASGNSVGDVYFVTADSSEYVWTSSNAWEQFGPTIDINGAIDTRLASKYDIYEGSGLLRIGSTDHNLYFTGNTAITLETADAGSGNGIELYDSYGYNYLRVNLTAGVTLLADHKFNISAAGGDTYVRTDDGMDLHLYGSGSVQVDGAFRIESDSPNASPFHYDAGCIQMCNGKVYLDYATNSNYTTNTFNIAIPNLYKTFNQNTMQYSNPYVTISDVRNDLGIQVVRTSQTYNVNLPGPNVNIISYDDTTGGCNFYDYLHWDDQDGAIVLGDPSNLLELKGDIYLEAGGAQGVHISDGDAFDVSLNNANFKVDSNGIISLALGSSNDFEITLDSTGMYADFDGSSGNYFQMGRDSNSVDIVIGDDPTNSNKTYYVTLRGTNINIEADTRIVADKLYKSYTSASVNNPYVDKQTYDSLVARVAALETVVHSE